MGSLLIPLIERAGETNPKISNAAKNAILSLIQIPAIGPQFVSTYILKKTKASGWRPYVARLELLTTILPQYQFGEDEHQIAKDVRITSVRK